MSKRKKNPIIEAYYTQLQLPNMHIIKVGNSRGFIVPKNLVLLHFLQHKPLYPLLLVGKEETEFSLPESYLQKSGNSYALTLNDAVIHDYKIPLKSKSIKLIIFYRTRFYDNEASITPININQ